MSTVDSSPPTHGRRHSRIHSRNLSIYFPRPGTLQSAAIAEDGVQEVDVEESSDGTPVDDIPVTSPRIRLSSAPVGKRLGEGFQFGGRPPGSSSPSSKQNGNAGPTRRGHHHKHSLSHNFFSFLDPTATAAPSTSSTGPTSAPPEPWEAITPFSPSASSKQTNFIQTQQVTHPLSLPSPSAEEPISRSAIVAGSLQFVLGAWLWVSGQQNGSLSCTGLGYWIVFDALGILLIKVLPQYLALPSSQTSARSYGNARVDAVAFFSQCVYLLFASVYICKETVEHLLLSVGSDQDGGGHHHHHSEEATAINFPIFLISLSLLSLIGSSYLFDNHAKLVDATGRHIVYPRIDIHALFRPSQTPHVVLSRSLTSNPWKTLLTNPFSATPLLFAVSLVLVAGLVPPSQHHHMDVILATLQTVMTFSIAYPAAVALGRVLLQTAPPRGIVGARLESFLRVMRELERHPDVLHLPPPHMWQLTPSSHSHSQYIHTNKLPTESLVVTMELHVRKEMDDASVLRITRWAWETVTHALGGSGACEVTVGIVRG
ncbi:hypothetical protein SISNIDRAFT_407039 [Sistotremastrum niveocremeum HHB9708]|uniref:Cation efflux protein n=2 Tax=Sistotremastraceae TaxID=3402574 RepID=A0A164YKM6_9AGAM|nr:hypothetical protein SISNIDRAFT_407039 [Sistotremastrum niveocremeum HHB9708]KZT43426.1 hypothetical protein SISSUDRAFT_978441 [Sistotremastrum suecicum HHB10207 ss-3]